MPQALTQVQGKQKWIRQGLKSFCSGMGEVLEHETFNAKTRKDSGKLDWVGHSTDSHTEKDAYIWRKVAKQIA